MAGHSPAVSTTADAGHGTSHTSRTGAIIVTPASRGIAREIQNQSETIARQFPKIAHLMREASVLIVDQQAEIERLRRVRNRLLNNQNRQ